MCHTQIQCQVFWPKRHTIHINSWTSALFHFMEFSSLSTISIRDHWHLRDLQMFHSKIMRERVALSMQCQLNGVRSMVHITSTCWWEYRKIFFGFEHWILWWRELCWWVYEMQEVQGLWRDAYTGTWIGLEGTKGDNPRGTISVICDKSVSRTHRVLGDFRQFWPF